MSVRSAHTLVANPVLSVRITNRRIIVSERVKPVRERRSRNIRVMEIDMSLIAERMLTDRVTQSRSERLEKVGRDVALPKNIITDMSWPTVRSAKVDTTGIL